MNDIYSFYQLISKYQIEIPIIQRDYAQGRNNTKAADVRKSLVENMIKAVKEDDKPLFFDFVYGRIDNNKFIPFDGQQRLTTLFLFHKYVFEKCQSISSCIYKDHCVCKDILKRFSYATRQSSREFCEKLVDNQIIPNSEKKLSDNIINQSWFFPDWKKDPTIVGMMTMLDEIHKQIKDEVNFNQLAEKLTSGCNCPITFHFVDMGEHKLSDETYVKMNARGKTLTPFENFKASLEQHLDEKKQKLLLSRCRDNMDGIWLDMFWDVSNSVDNEKKDLPDDLMMSFFNRHFMNVWRCWYAQNIDDDNNKINQKVIDEMPLYPTKDSFVSWDIYKYILDKCGIDECLLPVFNIWDELCKHDTKIQECCQPVWKRDKGIWDLFNGDRNNTNREEYTSRIAFYALLKFFNKINDNNGSYLSHWMRVVWNIIGNSTIDSTQTYHAALRLINKLSSKCECIYDALANHFDEFELGTIYHAKEQVLEEVSKAKKIISDPLWEISITKAEKCDYLSGKIWVLFQDGDNTSQELFNQRFHLLEDILADSDEYYLPKILISYYDKSYPDTYIEFKKSNENWKKLLTDGDKGLFTCFQKIKSNSINDNISYQWIKDIAETQLLNNSRNDAKIISKYGNSVVLWGTSGCRRYVFSNPVWGNVIVGNYRTILVDTKMELQNQGIIVKGTNFVSDFDVDFKYNGEYFQWYGIPNDNELDVYLMEKQGKVYKKRPDFEEGRPDKENYYCFRVTEEMKKDTSRFTNELEHIINEASVSHNIQ